MARWPAPPCGPADNCSLADAKAGLDNNGGGDATIYTVSISKGRDNVYVGAVDGLRINNDIYDFDVTGVQKISSP